MVPEPFSSATITDDRLDLIFGALAHPARRRILGRLVQGNAPVTELAQPFDMTARAISKHIAVLERAGLITREKDAQRRPSQLNVAALREAYQWLDAYRALWEQRFDRIDMVLQHVKDGDRTRARKSRHPRR